MSDLWVRFEVSKTAGRELLKAARQSTGLPVAEEAVFRIPGDRREEGLKAALQEFVRAGNPGQWMILYSGKPIGRDPDRKIFFPETVEFAVSYEKACAQVGKKEIPAQEPHAAPPIVMLSQPKAPKTVQPFRNSVQMKRQTVQNKQPIVQPLLPPAAPQIVQYFSGVAPVAQNKPKRKSRFRKYLYSAAAVGLLFAGIQIGDSLRASAAPQPQEYALNEFTAKTMHLPLSPSLLHHSVVPAAGHIDPMHTVTSSEIHNELALAAIHAAPAVYNVTSIDNNGTGYYYATAFAVEAHINGRLVGALMTAGHVIDELSSQGAQGIEISQTNPETGKVTVFYRILWGTNHPNVMDVSAMAPNVYALWGVKSWPWRPTFWPSPAFVHTQGIIWGWSDWDISVIPLSRPLPGALRIASFTGARAGQSVVAVGNPDNMGNQYGDISTFGRILANKVNFTDGWNQNEDHKGIMLRMNAFPGDSGAPILDAQGKVIGVLDATSATPDAQGNNEIVTWAQGINKYFLDWK